MLAIVKSDAYNHGIRTAVFIEYIVDGFGVSSTAEGVYLRELGIKKTIKALVFTAEERQNAGAFDIIPVISDIDTLIKVLHRQPSIKADIKIDSGMNRLGLKTQEDMSKLKGLVKKYENFKINSFHTHFAFSDYQKMCEQSKKFEELCQTVDKDIKKSACASGGLAYGKRFVYDEVRAGISLYGYMPMKNSFLPLSTALSLTAPILDIKIMKKGDLIGYGGLYKANKGDKIGIIRGGYFEGISRMARGWKVFVNGVQTQLVGSVCMDLSFVLLNGIDAKKGDEVIILSNANNAEELATHCGTIPYEILTSFKGRAKRIYYL